MENTVFSEVSFVSGLSANDFQIRVASSEIDEELPLPPEGNKIEHPMLRDSRFVLFMKELNIEQEWKSGSVSRYKAVSFDVEFWIWDNESGKVMAYGELDDIESACGFPGSCKMEHWEEATNTLGRALFRETPFSRFR